MNNVLEQFFESVAPEYDTNKQLFIDNMNMLRNMSNEEHTLYKKWKEVQRFQKMIDKSSVIKANIWQPENLLDRDLVLNEINNLRPEIVFVPPTDSKMMEEWLLLRTFIHTMEFEQNPGRFLRFIIRDENTGKYLGVSSIGSDVISITCRDKWIGWDKETKLTQGRIRHSAIATTIVGTQPFGYNFLGGKLIASLMCSPAVRHAWQNMYGEELVGLTTTSLYGKHSMYQRIPYWKELGETTGKVMLKPDDKFYDFWHHWLKENKTSEYEEKTTGSGVGPATGVKQKILVMIMQELKMKQTHYMHGFNRGVYYASLYKNTREFLRGEIDESELITSDRPLTLDSIVEWWREKAIRRYNNLLEQNRISDDILFYNKMIGMSWDEARENYLSEVGR